MAAHAKVFVQLIFARTQGSEGKQEILLKRKNGEASPEWVFVGGELLPDEVERAFAKDGKDVKWKNLSLAAVRTAALDLVNSNEMPETDFGKFGGNKERLPPSLLNMTRVKMQETMPEFTKNGKVFPFVCALDSQTDQAYASNKWPQKQADCKWFLLSDLQNQLERAQALLTPSKTAVSRPLQQAVQGGAGARPNGSPVSADHTTPNFVKPHGGKHANVAGAGNGYDQGNSYSMLNMYAPEIPAAGAYAQQQHFAQNYMPNFVMTPQVEMPQQSSLKFKFPAHIISLSVKTTGCKLSQDKVVAIGAAFVQIHDKNVVPVLKRHELFRCKIDAQVPLDPEYMTPDELKQLQTQAMLPEKAIRATLNFIQGCVREDASSFIAAQNPMVELGMLELAAAAHCDPFSSLSQLVAAEGGEFKAPIDLGSFACGLVSTDSRPAGNKTGSTKPPTNGRPWASLSEYLQQHLTTPGEMDKFIFFAQPQTGRLEPHQEAANRGWQFCNTICVLADKHLRAPPMPQNMGMMGGMGGNHMLYALQQQQQQQQQMHMMQWQQQMQMQMAYQQNYSAQQPNHAAHNRLPQHNKPYRNQSGRGSYQAPAGQGMAVAPHVQFMQPRHPMPAYDGSTAGAKPPVGSSDVSPDASSDALIAPIAAGASAAPTSVEVQQPQQAPENGNKPGASVQTAQVPAAPAPSGTFLNPSNPPVAVPKTGQGAFEPAQHQPMEQAAREVRAEEVGAGAPAGTQEKAPAVKVAAKSADASSDVPAKQEGPKSWAQMASKPPQLQAAARAVAAVVAATARGAPATQAADGHSENSGGASVADASRDDVSKGEGGEQRAGHRRETGRGDGTRKDSLAAAERGGGRGKGGNVGSGGGASGGREGGGGRGEGGGRGGDSSWKGRPGGGAGRVAAN